MNIVALLQNLLVPWLFFSGLYAVMCFSIRYKKPWVAFVVALVGFGLVVVCGYAAMKAMRSKKSAARTGQQNEPSWLVFLFLTMAIAWVLATVLGDLNFEFNMRPWYDIRDLNSHFAVDPSQTTGQRMIDTGRIFFTEDSKIDTHKAMSFKNGDLYCVAPVSVLDKAAGSGKLLKLVSYDFWVVGMNCCKGPGYGFSCGDAHDFQARAGLRLMRDAERPFYRLAVQQAEQEYGLKAAHPLFFTWLRDPNAFVDSYQETGYYLYYFGVLAHLGFSIIVTGVAAKCFERMGYF